MSFGLIQLIGCFCQLGVKRVYLLFIINYFFIDNNHAINRRHDNRVRYFNNSIFANNRIAVYILGLPNGITFTFNILNSVRFFFLYIAKRCKDVRLFSLQANHPTPCSFFVISRCRLSNLHHESYHNHQVYQYSCLFHSAQN